MAITVKHSKVSTVPDGDDTSVVRPSDWNADHQLIGTIPVDNGGTGASTLTGYVKGNGTAAMTASATVPSTDITGLGTMSTQNANNVTITGGSISGTTVSGYIPTTEKAVANGVATLDGGGTVPISQLPAAVLGALSYQGTWNASTNTPTLTSSVGTKGYYYVVSVAGSTNLNGITDWVVGDWAVYNGSIWQKVDNTDAVTSVNGYTGTVNLTYTDVGAFPATSTTGTGNVVLATGATQANPTISNYEDFTPTTAPAYSEGRVWYDNTEKALAFYNDSSALAVHVSQDLIFKVINNTGSTIPNGSPVYITGTSSGQTYPNVALAKADVAATSSVIGLTNGAIANGAIGYVTSQGTIDNVNTSTFTVGQVLYLSPYSAGQIMNTVPPTGITVQVGIATFINSSTGHIYVKQTTPLAVPASIITGTLGVDHGGTGATTLTGYVKGSGTSALTASSTIPTTDLSGTVTNAQLANSAITINGTSTSLGGSISVGTVTSVGLSAPSMFTVTGSPVTSSGTLALTYSGTALPLANGGTGATSAPAAMTNLMGYTSTTTAAGTTTLTNTSSFYQIFNGSSTQTIVLPVTSTLQTGWSFRITNNNTNSSALTVNSSGGNLVISVLSATTVTITCIGTTLTTAADWKATYSEFTNVTGSPATAASAVVLSNSPTITGSFALNGTSTSNASIGASQTTGTLNIGGSTQTGAITLGRSDGNQTVNIATGGTASGNTATVNIGTTGVGGSTTNINVGSTTGSQTINLGRTNETNTVNIASGTIGVTSTQTINIGANGSSGGINNINIGSSSNTSTTAIGGNLSVSGNVTGTINATGTLNATGAVTANNLTTQDGASGFTIKNATDATKIAQFDVSNFTTGTTNTYAYPASSGTLATTANISQTFAGATTFSQSTASSALILGSTVGTGAITIGRSTAAQTVNIATGANSASAKTINIGTAGTGSTTAITIGSSSGSTSTTTVNGTFQTPNPQATNGIVVNSATVSASYSLPSGSNAMSVGPITVASGQSVTVASGQRWVVL